MSKKGKFSYLYYWVKIAFISVVFFILMFLQVFQARKTNIISETIENTKNDIINLTLDISEIDIEIEEIRNSGIIDDYAVKILGMKKIKNDNFIIIESNND